MTSTAVTPPAASVSPKLVGSLINTFRIKAVAERLATHLQPGSNPNPSEFFNLCLSLARAIDCAIANSEVPPNAPALPLLLKQTCQRRNDLFLQPAILVLMISVKNACQFEWFMAKEAEELSSLANEIGNRFCNPGEIKTPSSDPPSVIPVIMSRFYPLMKMGQILVSLEVKPGYGAYVVDFHILKNMTHSPQERIRLFVAQIDNTETSVCITSPQQVNFLLNGRGVERRTNVLMDAGPQIPTNVTAMLKYGTNLLQAIGQFNGHYIVAVAFMSVMPSSDTVVPQDYVHSNVAASDPDSDIIEGASRVSLNCPISFTRIRTPVKGQSCKHLQCFDFKNFVDINARRPSWRCPHCNQNACYTDLRVDQNMVKVLKEVGEDVADVKISADGSWNLIKSDTHKESNNCPKGLSEQQEHASSSPILPVIMDLTDDDAMDMDVSEILDKKPLPTTLGSQPVDTNLTVQSLLDNAITVDQDDLWSGVADLESGFGTASTGLGIQPINSLPELPPRDFMTSPLTTHSSSALSRDVGSQANNMLMSQLSQLQQSQLVNNIEYGRLLQVPRNVSRNPVAIQALPAAQAQRAIPHLDSMSVNTPSLAARPSISLPVTANGLNVNSNMGRQHPISRSHTNFQQSSLPLHHHSTAQFAGRSTLAQASNALGVSSGMQVAPSQQGAGRPTLSPVASALGVSSGMQVASAMGVSSGLRMESQNLQQQEIRRLHPRSPSPGVGQSSSPLLQQQAVQMSRQSPGVGQLSSPLLPQQAVQMTRQPPSVPVQLDTTRGDGIRTPFMSQRAHVGVTQQVNPVTNNVVDLSSDDWRPTGRMRGSITGQAAAAYGDMVIRATTPQPGQAPQQPQQPQPNHASIPANLQAFLANSRSRSFYATQQPTSPMTQPSTTNGGSVQ